jgi:hypothetical protein
MKKASKIAIEAAEKEFERFADEMEIETNFSDEKDEDAIKLFESNKEIMIKAIQKGSLVINDNCEPVYTPVRSHESKPIVFKEPTGAALMAMDKRKSSESMARAYATMADMSGQHPSVFAKMVWRDLKVCQAVSAIFLG